MRDYRKTKKCKERGRLPQTLPKRKGRLIPVSRSGEGWREGGIGHGEKESCCAKADRTTKNV